MKIDKGNLISDKYNLLSCDISNVQQFSSLLEQNVENLKFNDLTIIIAECLLVYIDKDKTIELLKYINSKFENVIFLGYDLINSNDNFGKEMIINLRDRNISIPSYEKIITNKDQEARLIQSGFINALSVDMLTYYNEFISLEDRKKIESIEYLDEFEEFNLLQKHCCFLIGEKLTNDKIQSYFNYFSI